MEGYLFETDYFRFTSGELHLLRSRFAYKKIPFNQISSVYIGKGIKVKRPLLVLGFGLILAISSVGTLLYSVGFFQSFFTATDLFTHLVQVSKAMAGILVMIGFLLIIGIISIYQATVKTWVMRVDYLEGGFDVFSLEKLISQNVYFKLKKFVKANFNMIDQ